jgi:hypothetical protein
VRFVAGYSGVLGIGAALASGVAALGEWRVSGPLLAGGLSAEGRVVDEIERTTSSIWRIRDNDGLPRLDYYPVAEFKTASGETLQITAHVGGSSRSYANGDRVSIRYLAESPALGRLATFRELLFRACSFSALALGLLVLGAFAIYRAYSS